LEVFFDLDDQRAPSHRTDHVIRQAPAQLLGDFEAYRFRSFSVVGSQVYVDEAPVMLVGNLRTEAVDLIVVAGDAYDLCAEDVRTQNLRGLKIRWNKDPSLETFAGGMRSYGISQIARRGAGH